MQTSSKAETSIPMIQEEFRAVGEIEIFYTLYRISSRRAEYYAIEISSGEERDLCILGTESIKAQRLFEIFVNETVTPCTMRDILRDLNHGEEELKHRQNLCKI